MSAPSDKTVPLPASSDIFGKGFVALVTGANKGIGYFTALGLAQKGITVLVGARQESEGKAAVDKLLKAGVNTVEFIQLDVTKAASIEAAVKQVSGKFGKLDILVNNAGAIAAEPGLDHETVDDFRRIYEVNVFGVYGVTKAFAPLLRKSKHPRVVNVGSPLGSLFYTTKTPFKDFRQIAYNSSKSALNALTVQLSYELAKDGVKVNVADPGYCDTDLASHKGPRSAQQGAVASIRLATIGDDGPTGDYYNEDGRNYW